MRRNNQPLRLAQGSAPPIPGGPVVPINAETVPGRLSDGDGIEYIDSGIGVGRDDTGAFPKSPSSSPRRVQHPTNIRLDASECVSFRA